MYVLPGQDQLTIMSKTVLGLDSQYFVTSFEMEISLIANQS